jgi:hypothetical protein
MDWQWVLVFLLGGLVFWILEWIYDTFLWRNAQPRDGVTNDDVRATLMLREREILELRAQVDHLKGGHG